MFVKQRTIAIMLCVILTHCHASQDGPPHYHLDVSKIADAEPQIEKLSVYGNPGSYTVMGQRYFVQKSADHFHQSGIASWYGTKFNGRLTSNREVYDMTAMTAAHKTLPLPCYVRVTRTDTQQSVVVRVNDRGPFVDDRIIDLSYAAAQKLGMLTTGTAPVRIDVLASSSHNKQWLQTGAFADLSHAERAQTVLQNQLNLDAKITYHHKLYHVRLGPYSTQHAAQSTLTTLNKHHIAWIWSG